MTQREFERSLLQFVTDLTAAKSRRKIRLTTPLFSDGMIDSLKVLDMIVFVEAALRIRIPDPSITAANFRTVQAISRTFWSVSPVKSSRSDDPR